MLLSFENQRVIKFYLNFSVIVEVEVKFSGMSYININCGFGGYVLINFILKLIIINKINV